MNSKSIKHLLNGAFDLHLHVAPDMRERKIDALELIKKESKLGLKGVLLKSHVFSTVELAYLLNQLYPEFMTFGSITLNFPVGGINPQAVEAAIKMGAKIIFLPTYASEYFIKRFGKKRPGMPYPYPPDTKGISILQNGRLIPQMEEIIRIIVKEGKTLATGHISPSEIMVLIRRSKELGLKKILVNHPSSFISNISIADQKQMVKHGAFIEHCYVATLDKEHSVSITEIAEQIREVGVQNCIISTDLGQPSNPEPGDGLKEYIFQLLLHGLIEREIEIMIKDNPHRILGLNHKKGE